MDAAHVSRGTSPTATLATERRILNRWPGAFRGAWRVFDLGRLSLLMLLLILPVHSRESEQDLPEPRFEAVSVGVAPDLLRPAEMSGGPGTNDPGRVRYSRLPLINVLTIAFDTSVSNISGPPWLYREPFDFEAKLPAGTTKEQYRAMLRAMLVERFGLKYHTQISEVPGFRLAYQKPSKGLEKSQPKPPAEADPMESPAALMPGMVSKDADGFFGRPLHDGVNLAFAPGAIRVKGIGATMKDLATLLGNQLGRPVMDSTGLEGKYDFVLTCNTSEFVSEIGKPLRTPGDADFASIFSALQSQMGLRLERGSATIEHLAIDSINKIPTAN